MKWVPVCAVLLALPLTMASSPARSAKDPEPPDRVLLTATFYCQASTQDGEQWTWSSQLYNLDDQVHRAGPFCNRFDQPGPVDCDELREAVLASFYEHDKCVVHLEGSDFSSEPYLNHYRKFAAVCKGSRAQTVDIVYEACEPILRLE